MKGPTTIGLVLLLAGVGLWLFTPSHVTWGNHHYLKHWLAYGLMGVGALFTLVGARRR
jgi:hypothetical protein